MLFHHFCVCVEHLCQEKQCYTVGIKRIHRVSRYVKSRRILVCRCQVPSSTFILLVHNTVLITPQGKSVFRPFCQKSVKSIMVIFDKKPSQYSCTHLWFMSSRMYPNGPQGGTVLFNIKGCFCFHIVTVNIKFSNF